jgi:hypothetical protein
MELFRLLLGTQILLHFEEYTVMKTIAAGAVLFGAAMGGLMYVNSNSSQSSWMVAGVVYVLALFLVQFLQPMTTWKQSVRFNTVIAFVVAALVFIDTLVFHQGIFKDTNRSGALLYRVVALLAAVGMPTLIVGSLFGLSVGRLLRSHRSRLTSQSSDPRMRA